MHLVSVIIPTYNRAHIVTEAIESVLAQTYQSYEIIVVDDGSTDNTAEVLKKYGNKIKYYYQDNKGVSAARNRGIREANGDFIAFLDSDDLWKSDKIEKQVIVFQENQDLGLVYSYAEFLTVSTGKIQIKPRVICSNLRDLVEKDAILPTPTVMIRKKCLADIGLFAETIPGIEDFDLWFRIAEKYTFSFIPAVLAKARYFGPNLSSESDKMSHGYLIIYNKIISKYQRIFDVRYMKERLAVQHYSLGRSFIKSNNYKQSLQHIAESVKLYPFVGIKFARKEDSIVRKMILTIKPYLVIFYIKVIKGLKWKRLVL